MKLDKDAKEIKHAIETYTQLKAILKIEMMERCKSTVLDYKFRNKYGIERTELSSAIIQLFYDIGKEDGLKEVKDKVNKL